MMSETEAEVEDYEEVIKILIFCDVAVIGTKICICTSNFVEIG